jgi:hypothetical protein
MRQVSKLIVLLLIGLQLNAQEVINDLPSDKNDLSEVSFGLNSNTNGGLISGLNLRYTYALGDKKYRLFALEFTNVKHEKEERFSSNNTGSFIPGKISYLIAFRPSYGFQKNLFGKYAENGVKLNFTQAFGPTIGIVKPYFVEYDGLFVPFDPSKHVINSITGDAGIMYGMSQAKFNLGAHSRTSLNFEYGPADYLRIGIEPGITLEAYTKKNNLMILSEERRFYTAFFLHFYYGITF